MEKGSMGKLRRLLRALDLPEEVDLSVVKCTMLGGSDLLIENHRGILRYDADCVRLMTTEGVLRVTGEALVLTEFGGERIYLRGRIAGWVFEERGGCGNS